MQRGASLANPSFTIVSELGLELAANVMLSCKTKARQCKSSGAQLRAGVKSEETTNEKLGSTIAQP